MKFIPGLLFSFLFLACLFAKADDNILIRPYLSDKYGKGKTQREISAELGVSPSLVSKYLSGTVRSSPKIIRGFKRNFSDIFFELGRAQDLKLELASLRDGLLIRPSQIKTLMAGQPVCFPLFSSIAIAHRIEGNGKAAFYDHQTIRLATEMMTRPIYGPHHNQNDLESYSRDLPFNMHLAEQLPEPLSTIQEENYQSLLPHIPNAGLLVIAGRAREYESHLEQNRFEQALIRQAMTRGQPILAICAGCWPLWQYRPKVDKKNKKDKEKPCGLLKSVRWHACLPMIYMSKIHGRAVNNKQIHKVVLDEESLLKRILPGNPVHLRVNSVHTKAPDEIFIPQYFQISGRSVHDESLSPSNWGREMNVEQGTVEAFETRYGVPSFGIQWHPEAYKKESNTKEVENPKQHRAIIQYMAQAGISYSHKRRMIEELEDVFSRM